MPATCKTPGLNWRLEREQASGLAAQGLLELGAGRETDVADRLDPQQPEEQGAKAKRSTASTAMASQPGRGGSSRLVHGERGPGARWRRGTAHRGFKRPSRGAASVMPQCHDQLPDAAGPRCFAESSCRSLAWARNLQVPGRPAPKLRALLAALLNRCPAQQAVTSAKRRLPPGVAAMEPGEGSSNLSTP